MRVRCLFHECEHDGDLARYESAVVRCGGRIIGSIFDPDAEMGFVDCEIDEITKFKASLQGDEIGQFCEYVVPFKRASS